jgi:hypothetical protein
MRMRLVLIALLVVGCRGAEGKQDKGDETKPAPQVAAKTAPKPERTVVDDDVGQGEAHKSGAARWKDVGVYLDGQPISFLTFGELPITLKPTWLKVKKDAEMRAGTSDTGWRWGQQRAYRVVDYLRALRIDIQKVKAVHLYAPAFTESIVVTHDDLMSPKAKDLMFRFGGDINGKPLPVIPDHFANNVSPDKITGIMIYVDKKPPKLDRDEEGFMLDGQRQVGVPYYGEPVRGGVRVYLDDRLATIIKRQELDAKNATKATDGTLQWSLHDFLASKGVDLSKVVEGWVIREDLRAERLSPADLNTSLFAASSQASGGVVLGEKKVVANAIALHTHPIDPKDIPRPTADEQ